VRRELDVVKSSRCRLVQSPYFDRVEPKVWARAGAVGGVVASLVGDFAFTVAPQADRVEALEVAISFRFIEGGAQKVEAARVQVMVLAVCF
jgi:hypothetical protein